MWQQLYTNIYLTKRKEKQMNNSFRVVDLFSGCGGMSLGFQEAGFSIVSAYDNWDSAVEIYRQNFSHPIHKVNLMDPIALEMISADKPNLIIGGPPCQDFSISGKREFEGKRANLTTRYAEIIVSLKPEWFVMENVYNIEKSPILPAAINSFLPIC